MWRRGSIEERRIYYPVHGTTEEKKEWLKDHVQVTDNGCWEWNGYLEPSFGYSRISFGGQGYILGHRVSAHIFKGFDINSKLCVLHSCDYPPCVNPEHLTVDTMAENVADMIRKGRKCVWHGEKHPAAKLDTQKVLRIREEYPRMNAAERGMLAKELGVCKGTVEAVVKRRIWKHVA